MLPGIRSRVVRAFKKVILAIAIAFLLALLGVFNNVGYHVNSIEEFPFDPSRKFGACDVIYGFDATYNPLLYPFYWLMGRGHVVGNFSMFLIVGGWGQWEPLPGGAHRWNQRPGEPSEMSLSPEERSERFTLSMTTWGTIPNFIALLFLTIIIEAVRQRLLYIALFSGIIGFTVAGTAGTIVGLIAGVVFSLIYRYKLPKNNVLARYWSYISQ